MKRPRVVLSPERELPLLHFLWRWKISTTLALAAKFYPNRNLWGAYKRLCELERARHIEARPNPYGHKLWMLSKKGYSLIRDQLPTMREESFKTESPLHDLVVAAAHLGPWLLSAPPGVYFVAERELRCLNREEMPYWLPPETDHRPDGFWGLLREGKRISLALEVEITSKRRRDYHNIASEYCSMAARSEDNFQGVLWLTAKDSLTEFIHGELNRYRESTLHNFASLYGFFHDGWNTVIERGSHAGKTIHELLGNPAGNSPGKHGVNGREVLPEQLLLVTNKCPSKSARYQMVGSALFSA